MTPFTSAECARVAVTSQILGTDDGGDQICDVVVVVVVVVVGEGVVDKKSQTGRAAQKSWMKLTSRTASGNREVTSAASGHWVDTRSTWGIVLVHLGAGAGPKLRAEIQE